MTESVLYRAISINEWEDWNESKVFRCGRNTLECKQFFESEEAVRNFIFLSRERRFLPPYIYMLTVKIDKRCFDKIKYERQELDQYEAITIAGEELGKFNKCEKQIEKYDG